MMNSPQQQQVEQREVAAPTIQNDSPQLAQPPQLTHDERTRLQFRRVFVACPLR